MDEHHSTVKNLRCGQCGHTLPPGRGCAHCTDSERVTMQAGRVRGADRIERPGRHGRAERQPGRKALEC